MGYHRLRGDMDPRAIAGWQSSWRFRGAVRSFGLLAFALGVVLSVQIGCAWGRDKDPQPAAQSAPSTPTPDQSVADSPPADDAPMRAFYDYARVMFARQDYVAAAQAMERAYARDPRPLLLFNVGQAYRKAARYPEALKAYQHFLEIAPQHPMAADARDHIRTIQILNTQEGQRKQIELALEQSQQEIERMRTMGKTPLYKRAWFWTSVIGAAATVVAIGVGVKIYQDQRSSDTGLLSLH